MNDYQPTEKTLARRDMIDRLIRLATRVGNMSVDDCKAMNRHLDAFRDEQRERREAQYAARRAEAE